MVWASMRVVCFCNLKYLFLFPFALQFLLLPAVRMAFGWTTSLMVGLVVSRAFDQHSPRPAETFSVTADPRSTCRVLPS